MALESLVRRVRVALKRAASECLRPTACARRITESIVPIRTDRPSYLWHVDVPTTPYRPLSPDRPDRLDVHCFPTSDPDFAAVVRSLLDDLDHSDPSAVELESELRRTYPDARVRERDPLGSLAPGLVGWYVFRDGGR